MSSQPVQPAFLAVDAAGRSVVDCPCVNCGYNLRGVAVDGVCPECAHPIANSLRGFFLRFASPQWVRRVARGVLLILIAIAAAIVVPALATAIAIAVMAALSGGTLLSASTTGVQPLAIVRFASDLVPLALVISGILSLTCPDPADPTRAAAGRRLVRWVCILLPLGPITSLVFGLSMPPVPLITPGGPPPIPGPVFATLMAHGMIVAVVSMIVYGAAALAVLHYLAVLLRRIPRPGLVRLARTGFWGLLVSGGLLVFGYVFFALAVAPVLSTLMASLPVTGPASAPATMSSAVYVSVGPAGVATGGAANTRVPATLPFTPPAPGTMVGVAAGGCGLAGAGCAAVGFSIAALILLVLACRAFFDAAREAEGNAAIATPRTDGARPPSG